LKDINGLGGAGGARSHENTNLDDILRALNEKPKVAPAPKKKEVDESENQAPPKTWDEAIQRVADSVKKVAENMEEDDNDIIARLAKQVAKELENLANSAKLGKRAEMVAAGRDADNTVKLLLAELQKIHDNCRDQRVRDRLQRAMQAMKNFSTQLKILTAVKAAAAIGEQDADTQGQVVAVTRSLGKTMTESLNCVKAIRGGRLWKKAPS